MGERTGGFRPKPDAKRSKETAPLRTASATLGTDHLSETAVDFPPGHINLYLTGIGEPSDNTLRIVVAEGILGNPSPIAIDGVDLDLGEGRPIEVTGESRHFEISWDSYVAYVVRNESFWMAEPDEPAIVDQLERRFDSAFLKFVFTTTFARDDYPGPLQHWALYTLNHCIDVVSVVPPSVKRVMANGS